MADEKTNKTIANYLSHTQKYILENKKDFSTISTIKHKLIKKDNYDPVFDYTKEIVKRMERDKVSADLSKQITETLLPEMQNMKKEVILMALPFVLGIIAIVVFTILIGLSRPLNFSNPMVMYYSIGVLIGSMLLGFGYVQRLKIKTKTLSNSMLFQASSAYTAAKMQGQGSFGAFRILEEMKVKQGKELQLKINQPKIVYKQR